MNRYLTSLVREGNLVFRCPSCGSDLWEPSLLEEGHLICNGNGCLVHLPVMDWVTFIKRTGDDDPGIFLAVWYDVSDAGFYVQVNTEARRSENAESVRFCTAAGGGRSFTLLNHLTSIALMFTKDEAKRILAKFIGVGGELTIYQGNGDSDMWVKTTNIKDDVFHGAKVFFPLSSDIGPYFREIMAAMFASSTARPIF